MSTQFPAAAPDLAQYPRPHLAVDLILLTLVDAQLHVLMIEREEEPFARKWVLLGGFLHPGETVEACARRVLSEKAHLDGIKVRQLRAFSDPQRDPRGWVVSIAHFALVSYQMLHDAAGDNEALFLAEIVPDGDATTLRYGDQHIVPGFDHGAMIEAALAEIRESIDWSMAAFALLPRSFTLHELQHVYELILGKSLNKPYFRKKMLGQIFADGLRLQPTGRWTEGRRHRPAELYELVKTNAEGAAI